MKGKTKADDDGQLKFFAKGRVNVTTRDEALCYACRRLV